jgi:hypothetical protein
MSVFVNMSMLGLDRRVRLLGMKELDYSWGRGTVFYILPTLGWQKIRMGKSHSHTLWGAWLWWYVEAST